MNVPMSQSEIGQPSRNGWIGIIAVVAVFAAMVVNSKVVKIGSADDQEKKVFSKEVYGAAEFPNVQKYVVEHAVDSKILADAIAADSKEAGQKYGVPTSVGAVIPVMFTGIAGESTSGVYNVKVDGIPDDIIVRVQTGPAINGTDLRDATGKIEFGQFTNQIEYQDAGTAINNELKKNVLSTIDNSNLAGKKLKVTGAFKLINPKGWLVTPVKLSVE